MQDLPDIRNALYTRAEGLFWFSNSLLVLGHVLAVLLLNLKPEPFVLLASILIFAILIAIPWLREAESYFKGKADLCRRLILYADGLGRKIDDTDLMEIRSLAIGKKLSPAVFTPPYYASKLPVGPTRLADITAESAFFTGYIARKMFVFLCIALGASVLIVLGVFYAMTQLMQATSLVASCARLAASTVAFLLSCDFAVQAKRYYDLWHASLSTVRRCTVLADNTPTTTDQALSAVEEYHLTVIQSPPLPDRLFRLYGDDINKVYRQTRNGGE